MPESPKPNDPVLFAMLAVERELARPAQLVAALRACAGGGAAELAARLVEEAVLSPEAARLLEAETARVGSNHLVTMAGPVSPDSGTLAEEGGAESRTLSGPSAAELEADEAAGLPAEAEGRYEMRGVSGRGGQARVMLAYDALMEREVAFKVLRDPGTPGSMPSYSQRSTPGALRFLREARLTGLLEHPNIIPVHEVGRSRDGALYYTMRLVRGKTLSASLTEAKSLQERLKRLGPFWDICNATAFAHSRGIVHRDLKPDNVMVGEFGETVLLDWGVAKIKGQHDIRARDLEKELEQIQRLGSNETQAGATVGTPSYMSPEQAEGRVDDIDDRSDVWGLGAVLYEILTGQPPFKGPVPIVTLARVVKEPLTPVRQLCPEAPPELAAIAEKALQKSKDDRYGSAKELAAEVEAYMTGGKVHAYRYSSWELFKRFAAHNKPAVIAAAATLLVIVGALVSVSLSLAGERQAHAREASARAQERQERLTANFHLAQALTEKAQRLASEQRFISSAVFAAAALLHNPAHPKSPSFDEGFAAAHPRSRTARVVAASQVYVSRFGSLAGLARTLRGEDAFEQVAFSHDGALLAATEGRRVRLWDPASGEARPALEGHHDRVHGLAFSPDGKLLATGGRDRAVIVWELSTGKQRARLLGHTDAVWSVAFSHDGELIASGGWDHKVQLWEAASGRTRASLQGHTARINGVAFSPRGGILASASSDKTVRFWSVQDGKALPLVLEHEDEVLALAYSPDGWAIATASTDFKVRVFEAASGRPLHTLEGHREGPLALAFSPDGKLLASGGYDKTVRFWDVRTGQALLALEAHRDFVFGIAFAPDGKRLATSSYDRTVKLWEVRAANGVPTLAGHTDLVYSLGLSLDGKLLASGGWDRSVRVWDLEKRALRLQLEHGEVVDGGLVFARGDTLLASAGRDKRVRLWDVGSGRQIRELTGARLAVRGLSVSPDGKQLVSAGLDKVVRFWDLATARELKRLPEQAEAVDRTAFSPDGKLLATACYDKTVRLWDPEKGTLVRTLEGHQDWVSAVSFSPGGERLVSSGKDGVAILWETATGRILRRLEGHGQWVNEARFSPDGGLVATGSDDQTVRIWDAETGETLLIIPTSREVVALEFARDGDQLYVGDGLDVRLYPLDFSALDADPQKLLDEAEAMAGAGLDGFELEPR